MDLKYLLFLVVTCSYLLSGCTSGTPRHAPAAKRDSPLYRDSLRADALGLTPAAVFSSGFGRVSDIAHVLGNSVDELNPKEEDAKSIDDKWFEGVLERYKPQIRDSVEEEEDATVFAPFEDPRLRLRFVDETVKFYNEQGREFNHGINFYLSNRSTFRFFNQFLITADPEFSFVENKAPDDTDEAVNLRFQELTFSMRLGAAQLTVGRTPLWWGPGRHGSLLLSNNSRPFDLIQLSTAGPQLLPGFLRFLGHLQGEIFATRLEKARAIKRPYLAGMRVSSRVLPFLELGASRTAMFGGGDRSVTLETIWHVIAADTENDPDDPGDQRASVDARIIVPCSIQPFEIYGELGGEDEAGGFFSKEAYLVGFYLPRLGPSHIAELTFEVTDTTVSGSDRVWYTNRNYPDGYTYHDQIIGHHVGTDGLDIFAEVRLHPTDFLTLFLSYDYEEHFRKDPVEERLHQFRVGAEAEVLGGLWLSSFLGLDNWNNFGQVRGKDERGHVVGFAARWQF